MIDFVLENPGVPPGGFHRARFSLLIQVLHSYGSGCWNHCREARQAEASFVEASVVPRKQAERVGTGYSFVVEGRARRSLSHDDLWN
jgi:hypothetical protein